MGNYWFYDQNKVIQKIITITKDPTIISFRDNWIVSFVLQYQYHLKSFQKFGETEQLHYKYHMFYLLSA